MFINSLLNLSSRCKLEQDLDHLLGKGGHGQVYAGVRRKDEKEVTIKRIKKRSSERRREKSVPLNVLILQQMQDVPGVTSLIDFD